MIIVADNLRAYDDAFVHQLLLVYWLGPDIAIFIWGWSAVKAGLDVGQRIAAGKMMTTIDFVPRVCRSACS